MCIQNACLLIKSRAIICFVNMIRRPKFYKQEIRKYYYQTTHLLTWLELDGSMFKNRTGIIDKGYSDKTVTQVVFQQSLDRYVFVNKLFCTQIETNFQFENF